MNKSDVIKHILGERYLLPPVHQTATAFAPTNIALVKYWGKRNSELNLPMTSSLSISLADKGAEVTLSVHDKTHDSIMLNNQSIDPASAFAKRFSQFLDGFRKKSYFHADIHTTIPIAAGLASSACGFASLVCALNKLYDWNLSLTSLSILARLGSGSACRSLWQGFVEWHEGSCVDGMDSHGKVLAEQWPELCVGLLIMSTAEKNRSSREAMQQTVATSALYSAWPQKVVHDLGVVKQAIQSHDFSSLGAAAESNALTMHATMLSAWPAILYSLPDTVFAMQKIWKLRDEGLSIYFTQDAGPNVKLLFLEKDIAVIKNHFPHVEVIKPFQN